MKILIYEETRTIGLVWKRFLTRFNFEVFLSSQINDAAEILSQGGIDTFIVDASTGMRAVATLSDLASFSNPDISIIAVTSGRFFTDGAIFNLVPNLRSCVTTDIAPDDLAAMVEHFVSPDESIDARVAHPNQ